MREEIYHCIRCGFCTSRCVTLPEFRVESAGPRGRMLLLRGVIEGHLEITRRVAERLFQCTTCGACSLSCPAGLDPPLIFEEFRRVALEMGLTLEPHERIRRNVRKFGNPYGERVKRDVRRRGNVALFIGCTTRLRRKETLKNVLELAEMLNWSLVDEVCCGSPLLRIGDVKTSEELMRRNYEELKGFSKVVVLCAGCYRTFLKDYSKRGLIINAVHITEELLGKSVKAEIRRATYHDPCHLGRALGIYEEPRELLKSGGVELVEMERNRENSRCCGGGGGFRASYPEISAEIAKKRVKEAKSVSEILLTSCPFCHVNLRDVAEDSGLQVYDVVDVIRI